jgi:TrmH family RNA methyltransferase
MQIISSKENELVKHIKKLKDKKYRDSNNEYLIEGIKLLKEAIQENVNIKQIVLCDDCEKAEAIPKELMYEIAKQNCIYVTNKIFKYLSEVQAPQGVLAIIEKNNKDTQIDYSQDIIVAIDDIQDPGNLGTILRTVDSIGLKQILVSKNTVDAYNQKVIRATMGAIFRVKIIECEDIEKTLKEVRKHKFKIVVSTLQTENSIYDIDYKKKVIVIGNEANGVEQHIQEIADEKIKIPMIRKNRKPKCFSSNRDYLI